jgi:AraC family transcriptional regulator of adaptative response/methylated-DNA-[protein]-cysteine methyltransferase
MEGTSMTTQAASPTRSREAEVIHVAIGECSLGLVLVAGSGRGVRAILLGDDAEELRRDLARRLPGASLVDGGDALRETVAQLIGGIEDGGPQAGAAAVSLDLRGTPFQRTVWQALREVPPGSTATYAEIAARIGMPASARAVAQACAANALAVVVPCHRVVRSDGGLSGYRWGVERKRALLAREGARARTGS